MNGPVTGPLIGGFAAQYLGWRWTNWLVLIFGGVAWIMCACIKETYAPALLKKKAAKLRKETGDDRWWCRYDQKLSSKSGKSLISVWKTDCEDQYSKFSRSIFHGLLSCHLQSQFCGFGIPILL
jgi:MFS family permease